MVLASLKTLQNTTTIVLLFWRLFNFIETKLNRLNLSLHFKRQMILKEIAPQRHIPYQPISYQAEDRPIVPTTFGTM